MLLPRATRLDALTSSNSLRQAHTSEVAWREHILVTFALRLIVRGTIVSQPEQVVWECEAPYIGNIYINSGHKKGGFWAAN